MVLNIEDVDDLKEYNQKSVRIPLICKWFPHLPICQQGNNGNGFPGGFFDRIRDFFKSLRKVFKIFLIIIVLIVISIIIAIIYFSVKSLKMGVETFKSKKEVM